MVDQSAVPCLHKEADHRCGTHARYVLDRCRCGACREANVAYEARRKRWLGEFPREKAPMVSNRRAREHVKGLMDAGMGFKRIAQVAGVPASVVGAIVWGRWDRKAERIRWETEAALLAVELDVADGAKVDAGEAWEIIEELLARGWWKAEIGRRVHGESARSLQLSHHLVFAGSLRILRALMFEPVPDRLHNGTGGFYSPATDHEWRTVAPSTSGVPFDDGLLFELDRRRLWEAVRLAGDVEAMA